MPEQEMHTLMQRRGEEAETQRKGKADHEQASSDPPLGRPREASSVRAQDRGPGCRGVPGHCPRNSSE